MESIKKKALIEPIRHMRRIVPLILTAFFFTCAHETGTIPLIPVTGGNIAKDPYLFLTGNDTEMKLMWQLDRTAACSVSWGDSAGTYNLGDVNTPENSGDAFQHIHAHTITGLTPGATYYYRVTIDGEYHTGSFRQPPAPAATELKFIALGDTRTNSSIWNDVAGAVIGAISADSGFGTFILASGDLVTDGGNEWSWDGEFLNPDLANVRNLMASVPVISATGNHDLGGGLFKKYFPYPYQTSGATYWSFDYGPVHVAVVDQYADYSTGSAQHTWLDADLAASSKTWKFIVLHEPGWSAAGGHENNPNVQNYIEPIAEARGVSIVFGAHNHYYARAEVTYDTDKKMHHITTGGGGAPLHTPLTGQPNIVETEMAHHYCAVEISGNTLTFWAMKIDGTEIERFSITK